MLLCTFALSLAPVVFQRVAQGSRVNCQHHFLRQAQYHLLDRVLKDGTIRRGFLLAYLVRFSWLDMPWIWCSIG